MTTEIDIIGEPDLTKIKLPYFYNATITLNNKSITDPGLSGNLGKINLNDSFEMSMTSYVYLASDSTRTEIPLNQDSDEYTYKKSHLLLPGNTSLPTSLTFIDYGDYIRITGQVYDIAETKYEFLVRVVLEAYDKTSGDLIRTDVMERYFYFTTPLQANEFYWDPSWLEGQMTLDIDGQVVY